MLALLATLLVIHLVLFFVLPARAAQMLIEQFAFIPRHYGDLWTYVTYALIHADFMHLGFNSVWLLAFGTPLARRFGALRFFLFFAVTAAAGAVAHLLTHPGQMQLMVGASASVSGAMAATIRFAFQRGGPLWSHGKDPAVYNMPALPLTQALRDGRVLIFLVVWFGLNFLFGLGSFSLTGEEQSIAWQAHVGGFLAGLLLFGWFDPVARHADESSATSTEN